MDEAQCVNISKNQREDGGNLFSSYVMAGAWYFMCFLDPVIKEMFFYFYIYIYIDSHYKKTQ